jgi:hypothetical protein
MIKSVMPPTQTKKFSAHTMSIGFRITEAFNTNPIGSERDCITSPGRIIYTNKTPGR